MLSLLLFSRRRPTQVGVSLRARDVSLKHTVGQGLAGSAVSTARRLPRLTLAAKSVFCGSNIDSVRTVVECPCIAIEDRAEAVRRRGEGESRYDQRYHQRRKKHPSCAYLHKTLVFPSSSADKKRVNIGIKRGALLWSTGRLPSVLLLA